MGKFIYLAILAPEEDGGYSVTFPDLPGCLTCGDTLMESAEMAADAAKTYVASLMLHGERVPEASEHAVPDGCEGVYVFFETDEGYIVGGDVISAAEASRQLGVTPGRVTQMLDSGALQGYRRGRRTYVTADSVSTRLAESPKAGRPRKAAMAEERKGMP